MLLCLTLAVSKRHKGDHLTRNGPWKSSWGEMADWSASLDSMHKDVGSNLQWAAMEFVNIALYTVSLSCVKNVCCYGLYYLSYGNVGKHGSCV